MAMMYFSIACLIVCTNCLQDGVISTVVLTIASVFATLAGIPPSARGLLTLLHLGSTSKRLHYCPLLLLWPYWVGSSKGVGKRKSFCYGLFDCSLESPYKDSDIIIHSTHAILLVYYMCVGSLEHYETSFTTNHEASGIPLPALQPDMYKWATRYA